VRIVKRRTNPAAGAPAAPFALPGSAALPPQNPAELAESTSQVGEEKGGAEHHVVESPMVGTFYRAPAPEAPPFVEIGDTVRVGQTLCILEAMKLMNELQSEVNGVVRKILAENTAPVEYGQPLFEIETR
jgi:acetyl-CoA carboxylase biotin carboxyl carrier protein